MIRSPDSSPLKVFVRVTKYIHLSDWIIIPEDALEVSVFNAIREVNKKW